MQDSNIQSNLTFTNTFNNTGFISYSTNSNIDIVSTSAIILWDFDYGWTNGVFGYSSNCNIYTLDLQFNMTIIGSAINYTGICISAGPTYSVNVGIMAGYIEKSIFNIINGTFNVFQN